jgi:hypothetical protein
MDAINNLGRQVTRRITRSVFNGVQVTNASNPLAMMDPLFIKIWGSGNATEKKPKAGFGYFRINFSAVGDPTAVIGP